MKSAGRYISAAVSAGIIGGNDINLVNSAVVAKEKGFEVFPEFNLKYIQLLTLFESGYVVRAMLSVILETSMKSSGLMSVLIILNMEIVVNFLVVDVQ